MLKTTQKSNFVIGVDGGGTKTIAALSDLEGKILKVGKAGPSHLRNLGIKKAVKNVVISIEKTLPKKGKILSTFIGLPAVAEEYKEKKEKIKKEIKKYKKIAKIFEGEVKIGSDQDVALRAGIEGDGVMLNAGTGCVAIGKRGKNFVHVSGWGYLADEGGAFFVGQKVFQRVLKQVDGREDETILKSLIFKELKIEKEAQFLERVYQNSERIIPSFSVLVDKAFKKGDKVAKEILIEAAKEAALTAKTAIKKLKFQNEKFSLVLNGSMFKSEIFQKKVRKEIKKFAPKVNFVLLKKPPVIGAVKLALEQIKKFDLVIFDLDGVLIDSKKAWLWMHKKALESQGYFYSFKKIESHLGQTAERVISNLIPKRDKNRKKKIKRALKLVKKISREEQFYKKVKLIPFAKGILRKLKEKKFNLVLVTNSNKEFVNLILKKFSLKNYWKKIITADDNFKNKEKAFSFLISHFKTTPERTICIGDTTFDIKVAKKVGCKIIAIPGWHSAEILKKEKPDYLINSLKELTTLLK